MCQQPLNSAIKIDKNDGQKEATTTKKRLVGQRLNDTPFHNQTMYLLLRIYLGSFVL